jgi:ribosome maturation factor RimP
MAENSIVTSVRAFVEPIVADLGVEIYDLDYAGGQLIVTLDTPPGSEGGISLDVLALATRLISRELDHTDPIPGHYTLEVSSPGLERLLRTPAHFQREIGKTISVRLSNIVEGQRRLSGVLIAADDVAATVRLDDAALTERVIPYGQIDRARTVFVWGPAPKPGKGPSSKSAASKSAASKSATSKSATSKSATSKSAKRSATRPPTGSTPATSDDERRGTSDDPSSHDSSASSMSTEAP